MSSCASLSHMNPQSQERRGGLTRNLAAKSHLTFMKVQFSWCLDSMITAPQVFNRSFSAMTTSLSDIPDTHHLPASRSLIELMAFGTNFGQDHPDILRP
jgi:hypothetical protein